MKHRHIAPRPTRGEERYLGACRELAADLYAAGLLPRGQPAIVNVWHEPDCRRPQGGGCTCRPEIEIAGLPHEGDAI